MVSGWWWSGREISDCRFQIADFNLQSAFCNLKSAATHLTLFLEVSPVPFAHARNWLLVPSLLLGLWHAGGADADTPKNAGKPKYTNRLAKETSPYLLMHSHNPTD